MARLIGRPTMGAPLGSLPQSGEDIERMSPAARKIYLRQQLSLVESQIGAVLDRLAHDARRAYESLDWSGQSLDDDRWDSLSSLGYLVAERDALVEAIDGI